MNKLIVLVSAIAVLLFLIVYAGYTDKNPDIVYSFDDSVSSSETSSNGNPSDETSSPPSSAEQNSNSPPSNSGSENFLSSYKPEPKFSSTLKALSYTSATNKPKAAELSGKVLDSGKCGDNLNWELYSNGTLRIFGSGAMYDYYKYYEPSPWYKYRAEPFTNEEGTSFLNPDGTSYMPVKGYNEDNPNGWKIKAIRIEDGVTYIGDWAFYRVCVEDLVIPEGVKSIGAYSIRFSPVLKRLWLPDSLKTISDFGISRNVVLKNVYFGKSLEKIGNGGLQGNDAEEYIFPDTLTSIGEDMHEDFASIDTEKNNGVFSGCRSLKKVRLGKVDCVPQRALMHCSSLETIIIPKTATYIGEYAFSECTSLKTVEFEKDSACKKLDSYAFYSCTALKRFTGATALETVSKNAFAATKKLEEFEFSNKNKEFYGYIFSSCPLIWAKIGDSLYDVPSGFLNKTQITALYISGNVKSFGGQMISGCASLKNIYYNGTRSDWDKITKTVGWASDVSKSCVIHFKDNTTVLLKKALD